MTARVVCGASIHAIFQRRIQMFFSLRPSPSQEESSLKIWARWGSPFRRSLGNKHTNKHTHWHPIACIEWFWKLLCSSKRYQIVMTKCLHNYHYKYSGRENLLRWGRWSSRWPAQLCWRTASLSTWNSTSSHTTTRTSPTWIWSSTRSFPITWL